MRKIARIVRFSSLGRREYLRLDDLSSYVFLVLSGTLHIVHPDRFSSREIILFELHTESVFLGSCLKSENFSARSNENTEIAIMKLDDFNRIVEIQPELAIWTYRELEKLNGILSSRIAELALLPMRSRLYLYFLRLPAEAGEKDGFLLPSHEIIGAQIYASREAVTREMTDLKRRGILAYSRGYVRIINLQDLHNLFEKSTGPIFSQYL